MTISFPLFSSANAALAGATDTCDRRQRTRIYWDVAIIFFILTVAGRGYHAFSSHKTLNFIFSDGRGYYLYLPSIVIDHDVDFLNQMLTTFGPELDRLDYDVTERTNVGLVPNKYQAGMAMTLLPPFLVGHGLALVAHGVTGHDWFTPDGYTPLYQLSCLAFIMALSCFTMRMLDWIIETHFEVSGGALLAGVLAYWLGTNYAWYCFREPFMIHIIACFWVTAVVCLCVNMRRQAMEERRIGAMTMLMLAMAATMAVVVRPTNIFIAPVILWLLASLAYIGMFGRFMRMLPAAIPGLLPLAIQLVIWHSLTGDWIHYGYTGERFLWDDPALFDTLFSVQHKGLFTWTPMILLGAVGAGVYLFRDGVPNKPLVASWLLAGVMLWYMNSAWWWWSFGWAFGARAFLELAGLFVVGLVLLFDWVTRKPAVAWRPVATMALLCLMFNYVLMGLYQTKQIARMDVLTGGWQPEGAPQAWLQFVERERSQSAELTNP